MSASTAVAILPTTPTLRYDEMCRAIAAAYSIDEIKDMRDKAMALQIYAKQARNIEAERQATEIRLRAERRCGQLLAKTEKANGARGTGSNQYQVGSQRATPPLLDDLGISKTQSSRYQQLAAIPEPDFERAVKADRPTTTGIIAAHAPPKVNVVDDSALWMWGRIKEFEERGLLARDPNDVMATMLDHMKETTRELAPRLAAWLERIGE